MSVQPASDPKQSALLMIEFQRDWIDPDGKLNAMMADREQFAGAVEAGKRALRAARDADLFIAHAVYRFESGYPELGRPTYGLDAAIIRYGSFTGKGAEFADGFEPLPGELVVGGRTGVSAFAGSNLDSALRRRGIDTLYLAGFALHACVESTARHAKDLGYHVVILDDAVSAFGPAQRDYVLNEVMWMFAERSATDAFLGRRQQAAVAGAAA